MHKAKRWRLIPGGVKRAVAFAMSAFLLAGSLSLDSLAAEGDADAGSTSSGVSYEVLDKGGSPLEVTNADGVMTLSQSATSGSINDNAVSYLVFPKTDDKGTLSLSLKVNSYSFNNGGVFVGAFLPENSGDTHYFMSMGFRNPAGQSTTTNALSPYFWKNPTDTKPKNIGNGSPKNDLELAKEYTVNLSWDGEQMKVDVTGAPAAASKTFTDAHSDLYGQYAAERRMGIAIVGAVAEVKDMVYRNSAGEVLYDQNNVPDDGGDTGDGGDGGNTGGDGDNPAVDPSEPNGFVAKAANQAVTYTFDFTNYLAAIYERDETITDYQAAEAAKLPMKSSGLVTVNTANQAKFNSKDHGTMGAMDIDIAVAGTVKISVGCCYYTTNQEYSITSDTGEVTPATASADGNGSCANNAEFYYKGEAGTINFKSTGGYLHKIEITPIEESDLPSAGGDPSDPDGFVASSPLAANTYTFNFRDSTAKVYNSSQEMKNAGLVTVNSANKAKFNNATHGTIGAMNIDIAVAGTVKISVSSCSFNKNNVFAITSDTGEVIPPARSAEVDKCDDVVDFYYKGGAGSINFLSSGGYLHQIVISPIAESDIPDVGNGDDGEAVPENPNGFVAPTPAEGVAYTFNFGYPIAKIYDLSSTPIAVQNVTPLKSAGLVTVNSGNQAKYHSEHGISGKADLEIAVAGNCKINVVSCFYSGATDEITLSSSTGTISDPATQLAKGDSDGALKTFTYTGEAGSVRLQSTGGYIHAIDIVPIIKRENRKIEVWDFAEVQESDAALYHNNITSGFWKQSNLIGSGNASSSNQAIEFEYTVNKDKTVTFGDLTMRYENGDRLYGQITGTTYDPFSTMKYADGYTASGLWYCNGSAGTSRRYVIINNVEAGDKIVVYAGSHTAEVNDLHFEYQGSDANQDDTLPIGNKEGKKYEFIAKYDGSYKLYIGNSTNVKPFWHRVMVVPGAKVSGSIDLASTGITGYGLKFVNNATEDEFIAEVAADGTFTASLPAGYEYTAVLTGVVGYGFTNESKTVTVPDSAAVEGLSGVRLVVEEKDVQKFSGSFTGFDAGMDLTAVKIILAADPASQREDVVFYLAADGKFETYVESGISYTMAMEGVNDYEITGSTQVLLTAPEQREVKVAKKAVFKVAGSFLGLEGDAAVTSLKFVNMEDNMEYAAAIEGSSYSVSLRNGAYEAVAVVSVSGYSTVSHVVVDGSAVDRDLLFVSNAKVTAIPFVADIYVGYPDKENNYDTVREAVKACEGMRLSSASDRITVHIAPGVYREQVIINVPYVTFTNDEPEKEVKLTWYYGIGYEYYSIGSDGYYSEAAAFDKFGKSTAQKWGVAVYVKSGAAEFRAENITFESSFNKYVTEEEIADGVAPGGGDKKDYDRTSPTADVTSKAGTERAAALAVEGNLSEFYNCRLISSQDTLYTGNNIKGYFKSCYIEGNTDYIFGGGDFVYDGCELNFFGYSDTKSGGYITAAADGSTKGYVFRNCYITGNENMQVGAGDLGRPWRATATVSFLNTKLEYASIILPRGWNSMSGNLPQNANYAEYNTTAANGEKVDVSGRVVSVSAQNPIPDVTVVFNGWTPVYYKADTDNVTFVEALSIKTPAEEKIGVGDVLTANFSLGDNEYNNVSVIRWYRVAADGTEELVKSSVAQVDRNYTVAAEDKGAHIKVVVLPETVSGYTAAEQTVTTEAVVDGEESPVPPEKPIEEIIKDAMENGDVDAVVDEIIAGVELEDLSNEMQSNEEVLEQIKELDQRFKDDKDIVVDIEVAEEVGAEIVGSEINMVGAAINAREDEAILKVSKPEQPVKVENEKLTENVQLDIKLTSKGEEIKTLKIPMTITISIPKSLLGDKMETLVLLHYADDGSYENVSYKMNADNTVTFTVSHFSTFVFAKEGTGAATEPSNPTQPEEPGNPTQPTEPGNPTQPTDPSRPTQPTDPSRPTQPTDPSNPTQPTEPSNPTDPEDHDSDDDDEEESRNVVTTAVQTGDYMNGAVWCVVLAVAVAGMGTILVRRNRRRSE